MTIILLCLSHFSELNENYSAHGAKVVEFYKNKEGGLVSLERLWREHFLKIMKPKFMPELWSVEHNVQRYSYGIFLKIFLFLKFADLQ